jgi:hypothetical protein
VNAPFRSTCAALGRAAGALGVAAALSMPAASFGYETPKSVSGPELSMLVRTTIVALHHANITANYSVLHDLGDRQFQANFSQAALADMFRDFRQRGVSLAPAVLYDAQLEGQPLLTEDGLLRVVGYFPTEPQQIVFDVIYRSEDGMWRIDGINVGTRPADVASVAPVEPITAPQKSAYADSLPTDIVVPLPAEMGQTARVKSRSVDLMGETTN